VSENLTPKGVGFVLPRMEGHGFQPWRLSSQSGSALAAAVQLSSK
jgi:hypothetical protein